MKRVLIACLLLFCCGENPVEPEVVTNEIMVDTTPNVMCNSNEFTLEGNDVVLRRAVANYCNYQVSIRKPAIVLFNPAGEFRVGLGTYYTDSGLTEFLPPLTFSYGVATVAMDSIVNLNDDLYACTVGYWDNELEGLNQVVERFIDNYLNPSSKLVGVVKLNSLNSGDSIVN